MPRLVILVMLVMVMRRRYILDVPGGRTGDPAPGRLSKTLAYFRYKPIESSPQFQELGIPTSNVIQQTILPSL